MGRTLGWAVRAWVVVSTLCATLVWATDARAACGDGAIDGTDQCDDGNTTSSDGCSASCTDEVEVAFTVNAMQILERFCDTQVGGQTCNANDNPQSYTYYIEQVKIADQAFVTDPGLDVTPVGVCAADPSNFPASYSTLPMAGVNDEFNCAHWVRPRVAAHAGQQLSSDECAAFTGNLHPDAPGVGTSLIDDGVCVRPAWQFSKYVDPALGSFDIEMQASVGGRYCGQLGGCGPAHTPIDLRKGSETKLRLTVTFNGTTPSYTVINEPELNPQIVDGCPDSNPDCFDLYQARVYFDLTFDGVQPTCGPAGSASCGPPPALTPSPGEWGFPCMLSSGRWSCPLVTDTCNADGPCSVEQLDAGECVGALTEGFQDCEGYNWSECVSVFVNQSEGVSNNIDDDCDGTPDDEQCDGIDNNGDGQTDESVGSCLVRIALFPLCFQGTDEQFQARADQIRNLFTDQLNLSNCTQNIHFEVIPPSELNLACDQQPCWNDGFDDYLTSVMATFDGVTTGTSGQVLGRALEFDGLMGLTDRELCDLTEGISSGAVLWTEDSQTALHEFGHNLGLKDEYCSTSAGGPSVCNWGPPPKLGQACTTDEECKTTSPDGESRAAKCGASGCEVPDGWHPNWLGADLSCSPDSGEGCCEGDDRNDCDSVNPNVCYKGNLTEFPNRRCFMSEAGVTHTSFCARCQSHIKNPPNVRMSACWNNAAEDCAATQAPMDCAFHHTGNAPSMAALSVSVGPPDSGLNHFEIDDFTFGSGRLPLGAAPTGGRYKFEVSDSAGSLFVQHADLSFWPDLGSSLGTTAEPYSSVPLSFRFPVPSNVTGSTKLTVEASVDGGDPLVSTMNGDPPVAELVTPPQPMECGTDVILDASASFDPDGDTLRYRWSPASVFDDPARVDAIASLPLGDTEVELTVSDGIDQDSQSVTLTVQDTIAPLVVPIGAANLVLECAIDQYTELGANAVDICDSQVDVVIGGDVVDTHDPGTYVVSYESTDDSGNVGSADRVVDVRDTIPPTISVSVSPSVLWPPNHKMVDITPTLVVADACDSTPSVVLVGVVSNEPANGQGDGDTAPDIEITPTGKIRVRAERGGSGNGRQYTLTYRASDDSGNTAFAEAKVTVPHSKPK